MWDFLADPISKRFARLRTLTKIYVCAATAVLGLAALFAFDSQGLGKGVFFVCAPIALAVIAVATPIERFVLKLAVRKLQAKKSDQSPN